MTVVAASSVRRVIAFGIVAWGALAPSRAAAHCQATSTSGIQAPGEGCGTCPTDGVRLHWERPCIGVSIDPTGFATMGLGAEAVRGIAERSFRTWTETACGDVSGALDVRTTELVRCGDASYAPDGANVNAVTVLENWATHEPALSPEAFALTFVWFDTTSGEILDADLLVNPDQGPYAACGDVTCDAGAVDLGNVLTHEAGHFLGLAHSSVAEATMYCRAERGELSKRTLDLDDAAGFCAIYGASTIASRCDYAPEGGLAIDCSMPLSAPRGGCSIASGPSRGAGGFWAVFFTLGLVAALVRRAIVSARRHRTARSSPRTGAALAASLHSPRRP